jgi:coniferyl-aldehyde dehydrogenase
MRSYLDTAAFGAVLGGAAAEQALAACAFDHIICIGGAAAARRVAEAAAAHLTPLTLCCGGKCPCYVDSGCDVQMVARRIAAYVAWV